MAITTEQSTIQLSLSREELVFVLDVLQAKFLPGLDEDPEGEVGKEQQALVKRTVRRTLQARELLRVRANGEYALHNTLLRAVGVCAYPQTTIFVYHWAPGESVPARIFCHIRGRDGVIHERPDPVIHRFSVVSAAAVAQSVLDICGVQPAKESSEQEMSVENQVFLQARQFATDGKIKEANQLFIGAGASPKLAEDFVGSLAGVSAISILQVVKQDGQAHSKQDVTLVQNGVHNWIVQPFTSETDSPLLVRSLHVERLREILV